MMRSEEEARHSYQGVESQELPGVQVEQAESHPNMS